MEKNSDVFIGDNEFLNAIYGYKTFKQVNTNFYSVDGCCACRKLQVQNSTPTT